MITLHFLSSRVYRRYLAFSTLFLFCFSLFSWELTHFVSYAQTSPTITITGLVPNSGGQIKGTNPYYSRYTDINISFTTTNAPAGFRIQAFVDNSLKNTYVNPQQSGTLGAFPPFYPSTHTAQLIMKDSGGQTIASSAPVTVTVDTTKPTLSGIQVTYDGVTLKQNPPNASGTWLSRYPRPSFEWTSADNTGGVGLDLSTQSISINGTPIGGVTSPYTPSTDLTIGSQNSTLSIEDLAGNSTTISIPVIYDPNPPYMGPISLTSQVSTGLEQPYYTAPTVGGLITTAGSTISALLYGGDGTGESGGPTYSYSLDNITFTNLLGAVGTIPLVANSINTIYFRAIDNAGNIQNNLTDNSMFNVKTNPVQVRVDNTPPALSWTWNGQANTTPDSQWRNTDAIIKLSCTDNNPNCTVWKNQVSISSGQTPSCPTTYTTPNPYTFAGILTSSDIIISSSSKICARAMDNVGVVTASPVFTVNIDKTAPTISNTTLSASENKIVYKQGNVWYTNDPHPNIDFTATDTGGSDIRTQQNVRYTLPNQTPITLPFTGNHISTTNTTLTTGTSTIDILVSDNAGNVSTESIQVVFDDTPPAIIGAPLLTLNESQPHQLILQLPGVQDELSGVDQFEVQVMDIEGTGTMIDLTPHIDETAYIKKSPSDTTTLVIKNNNGVWPTQIPFKNMEKVSTTGVQLPYQIRLIAKDTLNNTSGLSTSNIVAFDTQAPGFSENPIFPSLPSKTLNNVQTIISPNRTVPFTFSAKEISNTYPSFAKHYPISLTVFQGEVTTTPAIESIIFYKTYANDVIASPETVELPTSFSSGAITFLLTDSSGNAVAYPATGNFHSGAKTMPFIPSTYTTYLLIDENQPNAYNNEIPVVQDPSISGDLGLKINIQDQGGLQNTAQVTYTTNTGQITTVQITIPDALFNNEHTVISGTLNILPSLLPNFPEGSQNTLSLTFTDTSGNDFIVSGISTTTDWTAPILSNIQTTITNGMLSISGTINDTSPVTMSIGSQSYPIPNTSTIRDFTENNIALTELQSPYMVTFSDGNNSPTTLIIDKTLSITTGEPSSTYELPLQFQLSGTGAENGEMRIQISGPAGLSFTPIEQTILGSHGTILLSQAPKGTYTITSSIVQNGQSITYIDTINNTIDLIPPKLKEESIRILSGEHNTPLVFNGGKYYAKEQIIRIEFAYDNYIEQSFPISAGINGGISLTSNTLITTPQQMSLYLGADGTEETYTLQFTDNAGNVTSKTITIVHDEQSVESIDGNSSIFSLYKGTSGIFAPTQESLLPFSQAINKYLSKDTLTGIVIKVNETTGIAPRVTITKGSTPIIQNTSMSTIAGEPTYFVLEKGDLPLDANTSNIFTISIEDILGNKRIETISIQQESIGPKITEWSINNNQLTTKETSITGVLSATGSSILHYQLLTNNIQTSSGTFSSITPSQEILPMTLSQEGDHTFTLIISDELGLSTSSTPITIKKDTIGPVIDSFQVRAIDPAKAIMHGSTWYTTSSHPTISLSTRDSGSGINTTTCTVTSNGSTSPIQSPCSEFSPTLNNDTIYQFQITVDDLAGNSTTSPITIIKDTSKPIFTGNFYQISSDDKRGKIDTYIPTPYKNGSYKAPMDHMELSLVEISTGIEKTYTFSQNNIQFTGGNAVLEKENSVITLRPFGNNNWLSLLTLTALAKTTPENTQAKYKIHATSFDLLGNTSEIEISPEIKFDTLPPLWISEPAFTNTTPVNSDNQPWIVTNNTELSFTAQVEEQSNNTLSVLGLPMNVIVYKGATQSPYTGIPYANILLNKTLTTNGTITEQITLPATFKEDIHVVMIDAFGNESETKTYSIIVDKESPVPNESNSPLVKQQRSSSGGATPNIQLQLNVKDNTELRTTVDVYYETEHVSLAIPGTLFNSAKNTLSGIWEIPRAQLPNFPQGERTSLHMVFTDIIGNTTDSDVISTIYDSISPQIQNLVYTYKNNKTLLDLSFDVTDVSPVQLMYDSKEIVKESSLSNTVRTITAKDIPVAASKTITIDDSITSPTSIVLNDNYFITIGAITSDAQLPIRLNVIVPDGKTANAISLQTKITGPNTFTEISKTSTWPNVTTDQTVQSEIFVQDPPKGTYTITSDLFIDGVLTTTYKDETIVSTDVITPKIQPTSIRLATVHEQKSLVQQNNTTYTNDTELEFFYTFGTFVEDSFPIRVTVDGVEKKSYASLPNQEDSIRISLLAQQKEDHIVSFTDAAGNSKQFIYTIVQDSMGSQLSPNRTSFTSLHKGTTDNFDPALAPQLLYSQATHQFVADTPHLGLVVYADDEWGNAPKVQVRKNGEIIITDQAMSPIPGENNSFILSKGDIPLEENQVAHMEIFIADTLGNISTEYFDVYFDHTNPILQTLLINDGKAYTNTSSLPITFSAQDNTELQYTILVNGQIAHQGTTTTATISNLTNIIDLHSEGDSIIKIQLQDIVGNIYVSPEQHIFYDHTAPVVSNITLSTTHPGEYVINKDSIWYSNDLFPLLDITMNDSGSGLPQDAVQYTLNGHPTASLVQSPSGLSYPLEEGKNTLTITIKDNAGNTVKKTISIIYDSLAPQFQGSIGIQDIIDKSAPNHEIQLTLPQVSDGNNSDISVIDTLSFRVIDTTTHQPITLDDITLSGGSGTLYDTDHTIFNISNENSIFPSVIGIKNLPKGSTDQPKNYIVELIAKDLIGNQSNQQTPRFSFDTLSPLDTGTITMNPSTTVTLDNVTWLMSNQKTTALTLSLEERTNSGRTLSFPIKITGKDTTTQSTLMTGEVYQNGTFSMPITFNEPYKGSMAIHIEDNAGNSTDLSPVPLWYTVSGPQQNGTQPLITSSTTTATNTLQLHIEGTDPTGFIPTITIHYNDQTVTIPIPEQLLSNDGRTVSGTIIINPEDLPQFPQGIQNVVTGTLTNNAGNSTTTPIIRTNVDFFSPKVQVTNLIYKENKTKADITLSVEDSSPVDIFLGTSQERKIHSENTVSTSPRTITLENIDISNLTSPYSMSVSDRMNTPTSIDLHDQLSITTEEQQSASKAILHFNLLPKDESQDLSQATMQVRIIPEGSTQYTTKEATFTGNKGNIDLYEAPMGSYKVETTLTIPNTPSQHYNDQININTDLISPKIDSSGFKLTAHTPDKSITYLDAKQLYMTNDTDVDLAFKILPYQEQSLPLLVAVNGVPYSSITQSMNTGFEGNITIPLPTNNAQGAYIISFTDQQGNTFMKTIELIQDSIAPHLNTEQNQPVLRMYEGTSGQFEPSDQIRMKQSTINGAYITTGDLAGIVVEAQDEWENAPIIEIQSNTTVIVPPTPFTPQSNVPHLFSFTKKDIPLIKNGNTPLTISITDTAGNKSISTLSIQQDTSGPIIDDLLWNNGNSTTARKDIAGIVSAHSSSQMHYKILTDNTTISEGVWDTATVTHVGLQSTLTQEGVHNLVLEITNELGLQTRSTPFALDVDSSAPTFQGSLKASTTTLGSISLTNDSPLKTTTTLDISKTKSSLLSFEIQNIADVHAPFSGYIQSSSEQVPLVFNQENKSASGSISLTEGDQNLSVIIKDSFGNAREWETTVRIDTSAPYIEPFTVEFTPTGDIYWQWNLHDTYSTVEYVEAEVRDLTSGERIVAKQEINSQFQNYTLSKESIRAGDTYTLTLIPRDELGNTSHPQSKSIEVSATQNNPHDIRIPLPWQGDEEIQQIQFTLINPNGEEIKEVMDKGTHFVLDAFLNQLDPKIEILPIGDYIVRVVPEPNNTGLPPIEFIFTIPPYYFSSTGDINGDGQNYGISDYKLFQDAVSKGIYTLSAQPPLSSIDEQEKTRRENIKNNLEINFQTAINTDFSLFLQH